MDFFVESFPSRFRANPASQPNNHITPLLNSITWLSLLEAEVVVVVVIEDEAADEAASAATEAGEVAQEVFH